MPKMRKELNYYMFNFPVYLLTYLQYPHINSNLGKPRDFIFNTQCKLGKRTRNHL